MNFRNVQKLLFLFVFVLFAAGSNVTLNCQSIDLPGKWKTLAETTEYRETPRYDQTVAYSKRLDAASDEIVYQSFGKSSEGRDLPLLIAASNSEFSPERAKRSGKAVVLIQAAIHAGESDGKDAGLALLRDIAITKQKSGLLKDVIILFVPIYNVDGHELFSKYNRINQNGPEMMGFRANSANQNLNRDYIKADTPETRAWLKLWNTWNPDFFIDCHVTDGADFRYNITYEFAHHGDIDPGLASWMKTHFEGSVVKQVEGNGNLLSRYVQLADSFDPSKGMYTFIATPRFATGYTPLLNRVGLLIEAHSVKPYKSRVLGTYDVLQFMIAELGANKKSLFEANMRAETQFESDVTDGTAIDLAFRIDNKASEIIFKGFEFESADSSISGGKTLVYTSKPRDYKVPQYDEAVVTGSVRAPLFYLIPPQWIDVIGRLEAHGVQYKRLKEAATFEVESYRFDSPAWARAPFEGRLPLTFKAHEIQESRKFPANTVVVPVNQKRGKVAIHFLEPAAPDSAMFWGFFNAIFEQKEYSESYVMEDIARKLLDENPDIKKQFEEKLKEPEFASNARARMRFLYEKSPYYDSRIGVYPVGMIRDRNEANRLK